MYMYIVDDGWGHNNLLIDTFVYPLKGLTQLVKESLFYTVIALHHL